MKNKKYSKGFTLVELLVVIAIIGILAAVVLVSLSSQRNKATESSALQSLKSAIPFVVDCAMRNIVVAAPSGNNPGTAICAGTTDPKWPDLPGTDCVYGGTGHASGGDLTTETVTLSACGTGRTITCNLSTGACN